MYENPFYEPYWVSENELEHYGVKGMKWGVRRYQNPDGTLTEAGKKRLDNYKRRQTHILNIQYAQTKKIDANFGKLRNKKVSSLQRDYLQKQHKQIYEAELKAIKAMSYNEMKREQVEVGKAIIAQIFLGNHMINGDRATYTKTRLRAPETKTPMEIHKDIKQIRKDAKSK